MCNKFEKCLQQKRTRRTKEYDSVRCLAHIMSRSTSSPEHPDLMGARTAWCLATDPLYTVLLVMPLGAYGVPLLLLAVCHFRSSNLCSMCRRGNGEGLELGRDTHRDKLPPTVEAPQQQSNMARRMEAIDLATSGGGNRTWVSSSRPRLDLKVWHVWM